MEAALNGPFGRIVLGSTPVTIGRAPGNQLVVNDPKVSSRHAEIHSQGQDYAIIDLGSTNGSFLNEQRLTPQVPKLLRAGDRVRVGDTELRYEVTGLPQREPTVYADSGQGSDPYSPPTVAAPPPFTGYGSGAFTPLPAPLVPSSPVPSTYPPPVPPYYGAPTNPRPSSNQGTRVAKPVQKRGGAMMVRGIVAVVLGLVLTFIFGAINGATGFTIVYIGLIVGGIIYFLVGLVRFLAGR
jgi:hypothetical protein